MPSQSEKKITVMHLIDCFHIGGGEMQMVDLLKRIDRKRFRPLVGCLRKEGPLLPALLENEVPVYEIPIRGALYYPRSLMEIVRLAALIRREKVTILHTQDLYSHLVGVPAAMLAHAPFVVTNRLDLGHTLNRWHRRALKTLAGGISKVMANSHAVRENLMLAEKIPLQKIEVIYNGVDLSRFNTTCSREKMKSFRPGDRMIVVVANLNPVKGHSVLLEAAVRVIAHCPQAKLAFIGQGALKQELEARARALSIENQVLFLGSRQDVPELLPCMEISVLPSLAEGFSNAILESMAAGLPVVATDVGGNREAIVEGETGFLVPPGDSSALADRILTLLENRPLAKTMGMAGRKRIETYFTLDQMVAETEAFYERLLQRGRPPEAEEAGVGRPWRGSERMRVS